MQLVEHFTKWLYFYIPDMAVHAMVGRSPNELYTEPELWHTGEFDPHPFAGKLGQKDTVKVHPDALPVTLKRIN